MTAERPATGDDPLVAGEAGPGWRRGTDAAAGRFEPVRLVLKRYNNSRL